MKRSDKYFTNLELFKLTGLSKRQLEHLKKSGYIKSLNRNNPSYNFVSLIIAKIYLLVPTPQKASTLFKNVPDWNQFLQECLTADVLLLDETNINIAFLAELEKCDIEILKFICKNRNNDEIIKDIKINLPNITKNICGIKCHLQIKKGYIIHLKNIRSNLLLKCIELNIDKKIYA